MSISSVDVSIVSLEPELLDSSVSFPVLVSSLLTLCVVAIVVVMFGARAPPGSSGDRNTSRITPHRGFEEAQPLFECFTYDSNVMRFTLILCLRGVFKDNSRAQASTCSLRCVADELTCVDLGSGGERRLETNVARSSLLASTDSLLLGTLEKIRRSHL